MAPKFVLNAYWGPRRETPEQCARRCWRMFSGLAAIDPAFDGWNVGHGETDVLLNTIHGDGLARLIADGVSRADDGRDPIPADGYVFGGYVQPATISVTLRFLLVVGSYAPAVNYRANTVGLDMEPLGEGGDVLITLPVFRQAVLAIASAWDATWCAAYPVDILPLWTPSVPPRPRFNMAWISYLSPRFAPMVTPPAAAISERLPDGGLLMIATEDRFDVADPAHLAAARDIEAALDPVNALPWPPDAT